MARRCKIKGCSESPDKRGLCSKHYMAAWRRIQAGETNWDELEKLGLVDPPGKRSGDFEEALEKARKQD